MNRFIRALTLPFLGNVVKMDEKKNVVIFGGEIIILKKKTNHAKKKKKRTSPSVRLMEKFIFDINFGRFFQIL